MGATHTLPAGHGLPAETQSKTEGGEMKSFTVDEMPTDEDYNEEAKRAISRIQMMHIIAFMACFCGRCRKSTRIVMAYKCRWCGVWYCHDCAALHFGQDRKGKE